MGRSCKNPHAVAVHRSGRRRGATRRQSVVLKTAFLAFVCAGTYALAPFTASAGATAAEAAALGGDKLTCNGAEKAGSTSGVAQWTGKFSGTWPGVTHNSGDRKSTRLNSRH